MTLVWAIILVGLTDVVIAHPVLSRIRCRSGARRVGLLPGFAASTPEAARAARLKALGTAGTYRVHNCGEILHVDYDRGDLIVAREGRLSR